VGGHGDQLARLGRGAFALRLPVHPQDPQVAKGTVPITGYGVTIVSDTYCNMCRIVRMK
jgi:hypothetical protein